MADMDIRKLKSGTDVRGVASPILGRKVTLTCDAAELIARAFCTWLARRTGKDTLKIAVGNDSRITAGATVAGI